MLILEKIKAHAKAGRTALINREERLTFAELDARSEAFAGWLLERFGGDRTPVVLYGHKATNLLPCIYGALKAGRGYVPIDLTTPPHRALEIMADVGPRVVVNLSRMDVGVGGAVVLEPGELGAILQDSPPQAVPRTSWISGDTPAYILFTSGSTGKPKGVPITAANLENFCAGLLPYLEGEGGVILHQISYSFDVSGCSIYAGLIRGMTLFTVDKEMLADMGALFACLGESGLTTWVSTPSFAELCAQSPAFTEKLLPGVRRFLFCGEVLTHKLCDTLAERFPQARVLNTYGPTEATVLVTAVWVTDALRADARPIPIGRPLNEVELRIVDGAGRQIQEDGASGELLIVSDSVGPGYLRRPDQTEKAFFDDHKTGKRGYRTGDICYRLGDLYYYTGRADNQLKLNGYRVEVEDVENNLAALPNIARAAVVPVWADAEHSRVRYLAAFLLLEHDDGLTPLKRSVQVKRQAADSLPAYMIPRKIIAVEEFPLNQSGKIDKKALAARLEKAARP